MESNAQTNQMNRVTPVTDVVDGAVGVEKRHWFVAIVNNHSERKTAENLQKPWAGGAYECYVTTQKKTRVWKNGRKNIVNEILLPAMIFIRCTKEKQKEAIRQHYVYGFLKNPGKNNFYDAAIIPDEQIAKFREMLEKANSTITIDNKQLKLGDKVRVKSGCLTDFVGNVIREPNATYLAIRIETLGYAKVQIDPNEVELVNEQ